MKLTINKLFNDANVVGAVIDRVLAQKLDVVFWKRHLDFEQTASRVFKTYLGTVTGVTAGSVIDRNSGKPLRERQSLGSGYGEVAYLGDRYQMDNDRLDMLQSLIDKYNVSKTTDQSRALNDIIAYITDDLRQVLLAPHKRMDLVLGELRSDGRASVKMADNPQGIELLDMELPVHRINPTARDKSKFISYLKEQVEELRHRFGAFGYMEMSRRTFNANIVGSGEFTDTYKLMFGHAEFKVAAGLISQDMASEVFTGIGLPAIRINEDMVQVGDGAMTSVFADNRISLFQSDKIGKMRWHTPYEITDPIPGKSYTRSEGGMYISNVRTDEGRFMEYGAEWIPEIKSPNKIVIFDLDRMNA